MTPGTVNAVFVANPGSTNSITHISPNTNFYILITLSGGSTGYSQTTTAILPSGMTAVGSSSCTVTNPSPATCTIEVNSGSATSGTQSISFTTSSGTAPATASISSVSFWTQITGLSGQPGGTYGNAINGNNAGIVGNSTTESLVLISSTYVMYLFQNESWTQLTGGTNQPGSTDEGLNGGSYLYTYMSPSNIIYRDSNDYLWTYNGSSWTQVTSATTTPSAIYSNSIASNSTIDSMYFTAGNPLQLYSYINGTLSSAITGTAPEPTTGYYIFGNASESALVIGDGNGIGTENIWTYNGSWTQITSDPATESQPGSSVNLIGIFGPASPTSIVLLDANYNLWAYNGANWESLTNGTGSPTKPDQVGGNTGTAGLVNNHNTSINNIVMADSSHALWTYNGTMWSKLTGGNGQPESVGALTSGYAAIIGEPTTTNVSIVDNNSNLWIYDGSWHQITDGTSHGGTQPTSVAPLGYGPSCGCAVFGNPTTTSITLVEAGTQHLWMFNNNVWTDMNSGAYSGLESVTAVFGTTWSESQIIVNDNTSYPNNVWLGRSSY